MIPRMYDPRPAAQRALAQIDASFSFAVSTAPGVPAMPQEFFHHIENARRELRLAIAQVNRVERQNMDTVTGRREDA